jgi:hypothetical protein
MSDNAIIPLPSAGVSVRPATPGDLAFIDALQKRHSHMVGFMQTSALAGKIAAGHVVVAQDSIAQRVGYCIGNDQYFKRDDVGIIYQLNVAPGKQRAFIGATLLKAMFDRAAYGCRLFCCWCALDIEANRFWEAMGFVPLAYRAGSAGKGRVHIFWQKRIRQGDSETPWWFPSQTSGGSIREDRIVLPIPPGTHWSDAKPIVLPGTRADEPGQLPAPASRPRKPKDKAPVPARRAINLMSGLRAQVTPDPVVEKSARKPKEKKPKAKNDPRLVAAARELKDRWLEHVNAGGASIEASGKYDVRRVLPGSPSAGVGPDVKQLPFAA